MIPPRPKTPMNPPKDKIICMIPARMGSERLKCKNLALLNGKPLIFYAIDAAKRSGVFDEIYLNSEDPLFQKIADRYGIRFHLRPKELGSSEARSDDVCEEMMRNHPGNILVWLNPIAPLQPVEEIRDVIRYFIDQDLDTLITVSREQAHCVLGDGKAVNFSYDEKFAKTQDLAPVQLFVYSIMMWRYQSFLAQYREKGYAQLSGKVGYFPVCRESSIIIKRENDLRIAELFLQTRGNQKFQLSYDHVLDKIILKNSGDYIKNK